MISTREVLLWWKSISSEEKKSIMKENNVERATFHFIKEKYLQTKQK